MIQLHFSNVHILYFTRILIITTQKEIKKVLIVFDDMIAGIMTNKEFQAIIKELFIRCRKRNISLVFITQSFITTFCSKRGKIKYNTLFDYEDQQQKRITKYCT